MAKSRGGKTWAVVCRRGRLRANVNNSLDVNRAPSWGRMWREALKSSVGRLSPRRRGPIVTLHPPRLGKKKKPSAEKALKTIPCGQEDSLARQKHNLVHPRLHFCTGEELKERVQMIEGNILESSAYIRGWVSYLGGG